ncbi:MAG: DUF4129 domain-containing protein [Anaerolineae bacterium]|nr:DUF4129 domain-containing protein [Anaerolineae bacterium]
MSSRATSTQPPAVTWRYRIWAEITVLIQAFGEVIPMALWVQQLGKIESGFPLTLSVFLSTTIGIYLIVKLYQYIQINPGVRLIIIFAWMALSIPISYHLLYEINGNFINFILSRMTVSNSAATMLPALAILVLFWRFTSLASRLPEASDLGKSLQAQLILVFLFGIAFPSYSQGYGLAAFYLIVLLGVISFMTRKVASLGELHGGRLPYMDHQWGLWMAAIAAAVLLAGLGLGWLFNGRLSILVGQATVLIVFGLIALIGVVLSPVLVLIFLGINILSDYYATQTGSEPVDLMGTENFNRMFEGATSRESLGPFLQSIEPYLWAGLVTLLLIIILWLARRQMMLRAIPVETDASGSTSTARKRTPKTLSRQIRERLRPGAFYQSARIRWIYARLCLLGKRLGEVRHTANTPQEYLERLNHIFPQHKAGLALITATYQTVRYGQMPEDPAILQTVEDHWKMIQQSGRIQLRKQRRARKK